MPRKGIPERFEQFHDTNPHVYRRLVTLARRWAKQRQGTEGDPFRLDNDYRAGYARLMMEREADLRGLFETRGTDPFGHRINPAQQRLPLD